MTTMQRLMLKMGISADTMGFRYLPVAVEIYGEQLRTGYRMQITGELYPEVAQAFGSNVSKVERAIRHSIERAADNAGLKNALWNLLGDSVNWKKGKPTNGQLIAALALLSEEEMEAMIRER